MTLLATGVPFFSLACAAPLWTNGVDHWLGSIPYVLALGMLPPCGFVAFAHTRALWTVRLLSSFGWTVLLAYGVSLPCAAGAAAGMFPYRDPASAVMPKVGLILLIVLAPAAWFVLRTLRLRYWQPGAAPETWEAGDEAPPAWSLSPRR